VELFDTGCREWKGEEAEGISGGGELDQWPTMCVCEHDVLQIIRAPWALIFPLKCGTLREWNEPNAAGLARVNTARVH